MIHSCAYLFVSGSKQIFENSQAVPIAAIIMEWIFSGKTDWSKGQVCPPDQVESLTKLLLKSSYVPFTLEQSGMALIKLDTSKHGLDWSYNTVIWLNSYIIPTII